MDKKPLSLKDRFSDFFHYRSWHTLRRRIPKTVPVLNLESKKSQDNRPSPWPAHNTEDPQWGLSQRNHSPGERARRCAYPVGVRTGKRTTHCFVTLSSRYEFFSWKTLYIINVCAKTGGVPPAGIFHRFFAFVLGTAPRIRSGLSFFSQSRSFDPIH